MSSFSGTINFTVLGNGANENPICLALTTDKGSHLFNCGEATQRLIFEHKLRIGKVKNIYLTSCRHEHFAGLFGYILTIAPIENSLTFHGPRKLEEIFRVYEPFLFSCANLKREFILIDNDDNKFVKHFEDEDITILSLPLFDVKQLINELTLVYLIQVKDKPGSLSIEKCKAFNIPPGPLYGELKNGNSIVFNGKTILPSDVLGPQTPGSSFLIIDCPTVNHLESLISNVHLKEALNKKCPEFIVHITSESIWNDVKYQEWLLLDAFNSTKHIVLNKSNRNELCLLSSTISQIKLNMIDSNIFKLLNENVVNNYQLPVPTEPLKSLIVCDCPVLFRYSLRKEVKMSFSDSLFNINADNIQKEVCEIRSDFYKHCQYYKENRVQTQHMKNVFKPNCLLLGTASSTPGVLRNTTGILLNFDRNQSFLLDCGEATLLQMIRYFGNDEIDEQLRSIKIVFISHIHADHNFGLISLMKRRDEAFINQDACPLLVIGPQMFKEFLSNYNRIFSLPEYQYITCNSLLFGKELLDNIDKENKNRLLKSLSLDDIVTVFVPHCFDSFGLVITWKGEKYVYSGDSAYSNSFDVAGKGCRLLIHEATMNDDLREEANLKRHSTISDAINVGLQIDAQHTILTHFSQRYAKVVQIQEVDLKKKDYYHNQVTLAYDFMNISFDELINSAKMKIAFETLFSDDIEKQKLKQSKKVAKRKHIEMEINS